MKCQDVRRTLPLLVDGQLALTEWAIIQGHLLECAECRKEVERLRTAAGVRARATHLRTTAMAVAAMAIALVVAVVGGYFIYQGRFPDVPSWSTVAPPWTATPTAPAPAPVDSAAQHRAARAGRARAAPGGDRLGSHPRSHRGPDAIAGACRSGAECAARRGGDAHAGPRPRPSLSGPGPGGPPG
jgi:hypothetical protein